jgi:indolepyruvate ferredoxin oxidoreductase
LHGVDATGLGLALLGDSIAANLFLLGYASQLGLLPVSPQAIERAVEINGVSIDFNKSAFALGRLQAADPARIDQALAQHRPQENFTPLSTLPEILAHRTELLTRYQDATWAERYRRLVDRVAEAEARSVPGSTTLAVAVARNFAKLMSYKDEYEVARLHADPTFLARLKESFEDGAHIRYNLAPPLLAKRDPRTGRLQKREFGPWVGRLFPILARLKGLRGTLFDPFGHTAERRMERALINEYEADFGAIADRLDHHNHSIAVRIAVIPELIRGYGHVKEANVQKAAEERARLREAFDNPQAALAAQKKTIPIRSVGGEKRAVALDRG